MSTAETAASRDSQLACPSCSAVNGETAKYCFSCGVPLWESCSACNASTRIGQRFCGGCGHNLGAEVDQRLRDTRGWLEMAREALERSEYEEAAAVAIRVIQRDDPRFAELSAEAQQLVDRAQQERHQWRLKVDEAREAVERATDAGDYERVIELLSPFPEPVLGETLARSLASARSQRAAIGDLSMRLRRAIEAKELVVAGRLVDELLLLRPQREEHTKLAIKIGRALLQSAERRFQNGLYADALARLDAVPQPARGTREYAQLRSRIDDAEWLSDQLARSPFATPALGRLAQRLAKIAPQGTETTTQLKRLATELRRGAADSRSLYPPWNDPPRGWAEAPIAVLNRPQEFAGGDTAVLNQHPTRFAVAIGLALQGIGLAAFAGQLRLAPARSALRRILHRPARVDTAWGVDAGTSAIRAVRLERTADGVRIAEALMMPLDQPLGRSEGAREATADLQQLLRQLAAKIAASGDIPVWGNLPAREALGRFLTLPPAPEKTLTKIVEQEIGSAFPVAVDELCVMHAITSSGGGSDGARAVMVAARRERVAQRARLFEEAGIQLHGLQADPVALHNFAHFELREYLGPRPADGTAPEGIALVDGGASGTTFYIATNEGFWFRFLDGGGEDLTARLAAACATTRQEAELLKMNPATIPALRGAMHEVESEMLQSARRLNQHFRSASDFFGDLRLEHIFCTGGAPLMHGWVRHVLQIAPQS